MTDESPIYTRMGREFAYHGKVNHSAGEYVTSWRFKHSNTAENFFSIFKRGVIGIYHHMSEAHLGRYCAGSTSATTPAISPMLNAQTLRSWAQSASASPIDSLTLSPVRWQEHSTQLPTQGYPMNERGE